MWSIKEKILLSFRLKEKNMFIVIVLRSFVFAISVISSLTLLLFEKFASEVGSGEWVLVFSYSRFFLIKLLWTIALPS